MKMFLPKMAAANEVMDAELKEAPGSYLAECVEDVQGSVIEMNLALVEMADCRSDEDEGLSSADEDSISISPSSAVCHNNGCHSDESCAEGNVFTEHSLRLPRERSSQRPCISLISESSVVDESAEQCSSNDDTRARET